MSSSHLVNYRVENASGQFHWNEGAAMLQRMAIFLVSILAVSQCFVEIGIVAQQPDETYRAQEHYDKSIHWIPMRDGTRLFTIIYSTRDSGRE